MRKIIAQNPAPIGGNWWDKLGKPQYGGELVVRASRNIVNFDPYFSEQLTTLQTAWMEKLHADDWTLDPTIFDYKTCWRPSQYLRGQLAEHWEFPDPGTFIAHLRKGVHWQDIPPANGREFIAEDVAFHFNRLYGLGGGFSKPAPFHATVPMFKNLISVTAADKYTVIFKWKTHNQEFMLEALLGIGLGLSIEDPDAVKKWGDVSDWHHAIGTGPFILNDFVSGGSATLIKNPNYWGHDERYPQNKLPYLDVVKYLIIPDDNAALEALLAGKVDIIDCVPPVKAQEIRKTNPEILQIRTPLPDTFSVDMRNDKAPFNDIRVRKALQMAIDLPAIAKSYYRGTVEPYPDTMTGRYVKGWGFPYEEWPQNLKDEYAYNPTASKKLLAEAGYPNGFKTNIVADAGGDIDLLQVVKTYFAQIGVDMEIQTMETAAWVTFVILGHKHDQLVHYPIGLLGHSSPPIHQLTRLQTGSRLNYQMISDPVCDDFYTKVIAATNVDEIKEIIRDANEYVARQHFAISLLQPMAYSLYQPWFKGFNAQFGSTWGAATGPLMLSHYLARFWIDQNLKKSAGH